MEIFAKDSILDVWQGSEYNPVQFLLRGEVTRSSPDSHKVFELEEKLSKVIFFTPFCNS